ncbi:hypothetical protein Leryth_026887 [Lithospermum erythrorhizon]|nr:hypothetical protein Leryth_026887 [Lithospermum erythrorhizon]
MEGRDNSDYDRNTTEELFIKCMMETPVGIAPPTMEMLGFRNLSHSFRTDSEELFKSWLKNGEITGSASANIATRTRSASRRIFTEPSNLSNQQNDGVLHKRKPEEIEFQQDSSIAVEASQDPIQHSVKNVAATSRQATNLFLAKAWFQSSQPMTRSRSSELRRRYAEMQNFQSPLGVDTTLLYRVPENDVKQDEYSNLNGFRHIAMNEGVNHLNEFASPSNSSSSAFNAPQIVAADNISSVVSMLKGTIERKKLGHNPDKEAVDESYFGYYGTEVLDHMNLYETQDHTYDTQGNLHNVILLQESEADVLPEVEGSFNANLDSNLVNINPTQMSVVSQEPSHSGSSTAAPVVSTAHDPYDDVNNSTQETTVCQSSRKQNGNAKERTYDNSRHGGKKQCLVRHGSVTSAGSVDQGDPTKKRRVERSKKMAEAKGRNSAPAIPSDIQSLLKRCENLEKEVRSLKLNLAFMNRKDSEQTKQIEELQKENKDLMDEKERLLEEIERVII